MLGLPALESNSPKVFEKLAVCPRRIFSSLCSLDWSLAQEESQEKPGAAWKKADSSVYLGQWGGRRDKPATLPHLHSQDYTLCKLRGNLHFPAPTPKSVCLFGMYISHPGFWKAILNIQWPRKANQCIFLCSMSAEDPLPIPKPGPLQPPKGTMSVCRETSGWDGQDKFGYKDITGWVPWGRTLRAGN